MFALQEFCAATKEYCPPGSLGAPGPPGESKLDIEVCTGIWNGVLIVLMKDVGVPTLH